MIAPLAGAAALGVIDAEDGVILRVELYLPLDRAEAAGLAARLDGAVLAGLFGGDGAAAMPAPRPRRRQGAARGGRQ